MTQIFVPYDYTALFFFPNLDLVVFSLTVEASLFIIPVYMLKGSKQVFKKTYIVCIFECLHTNAGKYKYKFFMLM